MKTLFNLPKKVKFCSKCLMSNQRPSSFVEYKHDKKRTGAGYLNIGSENLCDACIIAEQKNKVDWKQREKELIKILDKHRSKNGDYDCIVPGSGGKDSIFVAHILKNRFKMNPLTVTWPPIMYTDYGRENFNSWLDLGFDNISYNQNSFVKRILTNLSIKNLYHPFQPFILGQKNFATKIACKFNIKLIFYGENAAEYGSGRVKENLNKKMSNEFHSIKNHKNLYLAGEKINNLLKIKGVKLTDLKSYLPEDFDTVKRKKISLYYLGYFLKWTPQEVFYYAMNNSNFKVRPFRTQGTYTKYASIDDKVDDLHYYTYYIKYGLGRASRDASMEIRNKHLTREEGMALAKKFDGEFPSIYFQEIMDFINMQKEEFFRITDKFRSPHLWKKLGKKWKLRHTCNKDGYDD